MKWFWERRPDEDLSERLERLEHAMKQLQIDWTDTYDKFRRLHMRVAKQAQRAEQAPEEGDTQPAGVEGQTSDSPLTPRQQQAQLAILARRRRLGG